MMGVVEGGEALVTAEHSKQSRLTHDPRHPHCLVPDGELVAALAVAVSVSGCSPPSRGSAGWSHK